MDTKRTGLSKSAEVFLDNAVLKREISGRDIEMTCRVAEVIRRRFDQEQIRGHHPYQHAWWNRKSTPPLQAMGNSPDSGNSEFLQPDF